MDLEQSAAPELVLYAIVSAQALKKMGGNRGKLGAQLGHGFLHAFWDAHRRHSRLAQAYQEGQRAKKVVLVCEDEALMRDLVEAYRSRTGAVEVVDAGFTVFNEPTFTVVGIGPIDPAAREDRLRSLKVLL